MSQGEQAVLVYANKCLFADGAILQMQIWVVPKPVSGSNHSLKYRLFYGRAGQRTVLYDNERLKGDHRNDGVDEEPYAFTTVEKLVRDILADVAQAAGYNGSKS